MTGGMTHPLEESDDRGNRVVHVGNGLVDDAEPVQGVAAAPGSLLSGGHGLLTHLPVPGHESRYGLATCLVTGRHGGQGRFLS